MHPHTHYEHLAKLFDYPRWDYPRWVQGAYDVLAGRYIVAAAEVAAFAQELPTDGDAFTPEALDEVHEIFTRTFEVQAITTLGVGYVMFGDDYKRGETLVNLKREQRAAGIDAGSELPDHLPNVLRLIARWEDRKLAAEFAEELLHPALDRMIAAFGLRHMEHRNELYRKHYRTLIAASPERATIFRGPLAAVRRVVQDDFGLADIVPSEMNNDFLQSIQRELEIEADQENPVAQGGML